MSELATLYELASCDGCRRARRRLDASGVAYRRHDLRRDGLDEATVDRWLSRVDWTRLINRKSTTWRQLPESEKHSLDLQRAKQLLLAYPTLVPRPVLECGDELYPGWRE